MPEATLIFFVGASIFFACGYLLMRRPSSRLGVGGDVFVRRRRRKGIGQICIGIGIVFLGLGVTTQVYRSGVRQRPTAALANNPRAPLKSFPALFPADKVLLPIDVIAQVQEPTKLVTEAGLAPGTLIVHQPPSVKESDSVAAGLNKDNSVVSRKDAPMPSNPTGRESGDDALDKVNAYISKHPRELAAYVARGNIYLNQRKFNLAKEDYKAAADIDGNKAEVKFDLAETDFRSKNYDAARPGFAAIEQDVILGDLASYKVFLCDLWGGHEEQAARELDAFNQAGENASYYFANIASLLYNGKKEDAEGWLTSAERIYNPNKIYQYSFSLVNAGYLPPASPSGN